MKQTLYRLVVERFFLETCNVGWSLGHAWTRAPTTKQKYPDILHIWLTSRLAYAAVNHNYECWVWFASHLLFLCSSFERCAATWGWIWHSPPGSHKTFVNQCNCDQWVRCFRNTDVLECRHQQSLWTPGLGAPNLSGKSGFSPLSIGGSLFDDLFNLAQFSVLTSQSAWQMRNYKLRLVRTLSGYQTRTIWTRTATVATGARNHGIPQEADGRCCFFAFMWKDESDYQMQHARSHLEFCRPSQQFLPR